MVGSGIVVLVLAFVGSVAVKVSVESSSMVRSETKTVQIGPDADFVADRQHPKEELKVDSNTNLTSVDMAKLAARFCDYDFPMGTKDTNFCQDDHKNMMHIVDKLDPTMCLLAAQESGAYSGHNEFMVPQGNDDKYNVPSGCFKAPCGAHSTTHETCYYWNGAECTLDTAQTTTPVCKTTVTGTPVCVRDKHAYGTQDAQAGCKEGYKIIDDEDTCRTEATCLGHMPAHEFRVGIHNASKHLDHPQGCFIVVEDGHNMTYYNPPSAMGAGTNVKGMVICNVSSVTKWDGDSTATTAAPDDTAATTDAPAM